MPRLGTPLHYFNSQNSNHPQAARRRRYEKVAFVALLLVSSFFLLRNWILHDYRAVARHELQGLSMAEMERYVPMTASERREYSAAKTKTDSEQMKRDIAYLMRAVEELKTTRNGTGAVVGNGPTQSGTVVSKNRG
jgi:hypothetical protein